MWAAEYAELETVRFMIERGADMHRISEANMNGVRSNETAIGLAKEQRRDDVVALLQRHGGVDAPAPPRGGFLLDRVRDALFG